MGNLGLDRGTSFDLDFHTIPFHGEDALAEKHYVSKCSRRQKGILAFLVQDAVSRAYRTPKILDRLLGIQIGQGYEIAKSKHISRDLVNGMAQAVLGEKEISIHLQMSVRSINDGRTSTLSDGTLMIPSLPDPKKLTGSRKRSLWSA
jgi:hypothetical protein